MDRQTLRDWVHRFNAEGVAGLSDRPHAGGVRARLSPAQQEQVADWVRAGPVLEKDGVVRWRRIDLQAKIAETFGLHLHERSVGKLLRRLGFRHISVRPRHPRAEVSAQEAHKKTLPHWFPKSSRPTPAVKPSSFGGKTKRGSVSRAA
jgi:transposase